MVPSRRVRFRRRCAGTYPRLNISIGFCTELGASISMAGPLALFPKKTKHMLARNLPQSRRSGQSVPRLHQILQAKFGPHETDIAGRAAKCAASGAFAAKVDDAPSARETPHRQGRARKASG